MWKDMAMNGFGVYTWADGRKYEGCFENDLKQGYGVYSYADGSKYSGSWVNGKMHGFGIYTLPGGKKKKFGIWKDGKKQETLKKDQIKAMI